MPAQRRGWERKTERGNQYKPYQQPRNANNNSHQYEQDYETTRPRFVETYTDITMHEISDQLYLSSRLGVCNRKKMEELGVSPFNSAC